MVCVAGSAFAQDDDLPALPTNKPTQVKPKPKPRPPVLKPKVKKPVPDDDLPSLVAPSSPVNVKLANASQVKGAKLYLDERELGTLPMGPQQIPNGDHTLTSRRPGYATFTKKIAVNGRAQDVTATLEATAAVLTVSSDVAGAEVYVNGRPVGTTPISDLEVPAGSVDIQVKKDGYRDGSHTVAVKAGRDYPVEVKLGAPIATAVAVSDRPLANDLTPDVGIGDPSITKSYDSSPPVYKRAWFWAVIAVGVAAIATGVSIAVYQASPTPKLADSALCQPCDAILEFGR